MSLRESPLLQKLEGKSQPPKSEAEVTGSGCQTKHQVVCTKLYNFSLVNMAQKSARMLLDESERGEWKTGLKLNIQKTKIMASGSVTSWAVDGKIVETETLFSCALKRCKW